MTFKVGQGPKSGPEVVRNNAPGQSHSHGQPGQSETKGRLYAPMTTTPTRQSELETHVHNLRPGSKVNLLEMVTIADRNIRSALNALNTPTALNTRNALNAPSAQNARNALNIPTAPNTRSDLTLPAT